MVLAMRTIPVAAGMGNVDLPVALMVGALGQHVWAVLLPAPLHCLQGFSMSRQDHVFVLCQEAVFKFVDDGREEDHFIPPRKKQGKNRGKNRDTPRISPPNVTSR
jgi:hypothetical protein